MDAHPWIVVSEISYYVRCKRCRVTYWHDTKLIDLNVWAAKRDSLRAQHALCN